MAELRKRTIIYNRCTAVTRYSKLRFLIGWSTVYRRRPVTPDRDSRSEALYGTASRSGGRLLRLPTILSSFGRPTGESCLSDQTVKLLMGWAIHVSHRLYSEDGGRKLLTRTIHRIPMTENIKPRQHRDDGFDLGSGGLRQSYVTA